MIEAMTQPQAEVNQRFDDIMAQQMAMDGMMAAVAAMQRMDTATDQASMMAAMTEMNLATPSLSYDAAVDAHRWQLNTARAAAADEAHQRSVLESLDFDSEDDLVGSK